MTAAPDRVAAITGAGGRLGSAAVAAFQADGWTVRPWTRSEFDLDRPGAVSSQLQIDRPDLVVHAAAWTDVDGCARDPALAMARNGLATRALAEACVRYDASLIIVSTNEVFDGSRLDGQGYVPTDPPLPANAYGRSKRAAEVAALAAFGGRRDLGIVRTSWLFGPGKPDFPARIADAARKARAEARPLRLVGDEIGTPTFVVDLADALVRLASGAFEGIHHVVNAGSASRLEWARDVFERLSIAVEIEEISLDDYQRPSRPPKWGVLSPTPLPGGPLRPWRDAMAERIGMMGVVA